MVKIFRHVLLRKGYDRRMTHEWGMGKGFILSGIHVITGRRVRRRRKVEWQQTRQRYDKSPTSKA